MPSIGLDVSAMWARPTRASRPAEDRQHERPSEAVAASLPRHRDIRYQTPMPAAPGADGTAIIVGIEAAKRTASGARDLELSRPLGRFPSRAARASFRGRRR